MKRILVTFLTALGISGPFVAHLAAQNNAQEADIPFAFVVSHRILPAGKYRVSQTAPGAPVFALRGPGSTVLIMLPKNENGKPQNPSLSFAHYGNEYVLAKITPPDSPTAYALSQSSIENNLSHKLGMSSMVVVKLGSR